MACILAQNVQITRSRYREALDVVYLHPIDATEMVLPVATKLLIDVCVLVTDPWFLLCHKKEKIFWKKYCCRNRQTCPNYTRTGIRRGQRGKGLEVTICYLLSCSSSLHRFVFPTETTYSARTAVSMIAIHSESTAKLY